MPDNIPVTLSNPYCGGIWLRGNLHTHTTVSDGVLTPEQALAEYEARGYDFLALSDHDNLVDPAQYQASTTMTLIPADEVSKNGPHILSVQITALIAPDADRQRVIDDTNAQGGFAILNHPNWQRHFNHFPQELIESLTGYVGIEIYNGVIERLPGSALATDRWDRLLSSGRRVWGYAHDDMHRPIDLARGWNVAQAAERSVAAICHALRSGSCYASTGVVIERISVEEATVTITAPNAQRIRFLGAYGEEFAFADASEASYTATGKEGGYIRVECYGAGVAAAWTQPFFFDRS